MSVYHKKYIVSCYYYYYISSMYKYRKNLKKIFYIL